MVWQYVRWLESRSFRKIGENTAFFQNDHDSVSHRRDICACNNPSSIVRNCSRAICRSEFARVFRKLRVHRSLAAVNTSMAFLRRVNVLGSTRMRVAYVKLSQVDSHLNGRSYLSRKISSREDEKKKRRSI